MSDTSVLVAALQAELDAFAQRLAEGLDVAPARRARFEGMTAAVLAQGMDADALLASCRPHVPADARLVARADTCALQLDLWQRRAPVELGSKGD